MSEWDFAGAIEAEIRYDVFGVGDVWTWTGICADTKLVPAWFVGTRDADSAAIFIKDLAKQLAHSVQLTTDGHKAYLTAIADAFGDEIDYAMPVKLSGNDPDAQKKPEKRYSPGECVGCKIF